MTSRIKAGFDPKEGNLVTAFLFEHFFIERLQKLNPLSAEIGDQLVDYILVEHFLFFIRVFLEESSNLLLCNTNSRLSQHLQPLFVIKKPISIIVIPLQALIKVNIAFTTFFRKYLFNNEQDVIRLEIRSNGDQIIPGKLRSLLNVFNFTNLAFLNELVIIPEILIAKPDFDKALEEFVFGDVDGDILPKSKKLSDR